MKKRFLVLIFLLIVLILPKNVFAADIYLDTDRRSSGVYIPGTIKSLSGGNAYVSVNRSRDGISASYSGNTCGTTTASYVDNQGSHSISISYKEAWKGPFTVDVYFKTKPASRSARVNVAYESCTQVKINDEIYYRCTQKYTRCGTNGGGTVTPKPTISCYCSAPISEGGECKKQTQADGYYRLKQPDSSCEAPPMVNPIKFCEGSSIKEGTSVKEASTCEGETELKINNTICDSEGNYYSVNSETKYIADFDMGKDGVETDFLEMKSSVSFAYDIKVTSIKKVNGSFNVTRWKNDYQTALDIRNDAKNALAKGGTTLSEDLVSTYNSIVNEMENTMDSLASVVNYYNSNYVNYTYDNENDPKITLSFDYKSNNNTKTQTINAFIRNDAKSKDGSFQRNKTKVLSYTTYDGKKVETYNFDYSNEGDNRVRYMIPPEVILDGLTGDISSNATKVKISGGNRIYTDFKNVDSGIYPLSIEVSELGSALSRIINNKCSLKVYQTELIYRVINVNNPFINDSYTPGINWLNSRYNYDFTRIIPNGSTYKKQYNLTTDDIIKIQKSNNSYTGSSEYLGTCHLKDTNDPAYGILCQ